MAPVSIRTNNPGALNVASWIRAYPGYTGASLTTPGNSTVSFATPEHGVAAWWELIARYQDAGYTTLMSIIFRYCGAGREAEAKDYLEFVTRRSGVLGSATVYLGSDHQLVGLARAFFRYEAGVESPLKDSQIIAGFAMGRHYRDSGEAAGESNQTPRYPGDPQRSQGLLGLVFRALKALAPLLLGLLKRK